MDHLIQKLTRLILRHFPGAELEFESRDETRVGGLMTWAGFEGCEPLERQQRLWKVIRSELPREEQLRVLAVLTLTPEETAHARAG